MARILIFAPHPDDAEIAMGASIAKFIAQGHDVLLCDCTDGEPTPRGSPEIRAREAAEAGRILGVRRFNLGWRNRFVQHSIEARHAAAGVIRAHQAQILFAPYFEDAHPDHLAVTRIVEDAKFDAKLTKLDMPAPPGCAGHPGPTPSPPVYPRWLFYYYASHLRITDRCGGGGALLQPRTAGGGGSRVAGTGLSDRPPIG